MTSATVDALLLRPVSEWYDAIIDVPCDYIRPDPENLRQDFDEADLVDLGRNIIAVGQLDEITVFPILTHDGKWDGSFDLHDGERRWRAAQLVGLPTLRAKIVQRPSAEELTFKKVSRVLQTRSLSPETKLKALEKSLSELGVLDSPTEWDTYRSTLGGGPDWPQLLRVLKLHPKVRSMFEEGLINFTIAQSIGRVNPDRQRSLAEFVVVNKINGRFFSTQIVPYLVEHPEASPAQAFEQARVGGWRQHSTTPYGKGQAPPVDEQVEKFLDACVAWERAWETVVVRGLVHEIVDSPQYTSRLREASQRIQERAQALAERMRTTVDNVPPGIAGELPSGDVTEAQDALVTLDGG